MLFFFIFSLRWGILASLFVCAPSVEELALGLVQFFFFFFFFFFFSKAHRTQERKNTKLDSLSFSLFLGIIITTMQLKKKTEEFSRVHWALSRCWSH
jgi:hypothetical protein